VVVIVVRWHLAVQSVVLPESSACMQSIDTQLVFVAHGVLLFGSHVSCGADTTPSPQRA
jgi:hypothetical protein